MMRTIEMQPVDAPATERMNDELLRQYERNTTKRPLLCFTALVLLPFANELVCRIAGAW
jgi:hypothetical protein